MDHVWRVFRLTQRFATELDADHDVVGCAALTYDLHHVLGEGTGRDPVDTLQIVGRVLDGVSVAPERI